MIEFYKEVARYRADIEHARTGQMIDYWAVVYEGPQPGQFHIRHSHTTQAEGAAGPYYSNTMTKADSAEDAEQRVRTWCQSIVDGHMVVEWPYD